MAVLAKLRQGIPCSERCCYSVAQIRDDLRESTDAYISPADLEFVLRRLDKAEGLLELRPDEDDAYYRDPGEGWWENHSCSEGCEDAHVCFFDEDICDLKERTDCNQDHKADTRLIADCHHLLERMYYSY